MIPCIKGISVLGAILTIYAQDLLIVANEALHSELMSYILAMPFLFAFILYRKRKMLRTVISFETTDRIKKQAYTNETFGYLYLYLLGYDGPCHYHHP